LTNCTIKNATSGVYVNADAEIQSCLFADNQYYGLITGANADPALISGNSFSGNGKDSTYVAP
jgi:nitrous oxidase accessory protein NosD